MERRAQFRQATQFSARLRLLGPVEKDLAVRVEDLSGAGAQISSPEPVQVSAPIKLEWEDAMFLGECVHSTEMAGGGYQVGIRFEHVLGGLEDLRNLMRSLLEETGQGRRSGEELERARQAMGGQSHTGPKPD